MSLDQNDKRELLQLWYVADYYMRAAKSIYNEDSLNISIKDFSDKCKSLSEIERVSSTILCIAHLDSAAARMWSIDEKLQSEEGMRSSMSIYNNNIKKYIMDNKRIDDFTTCKANLKKYMDETIHLVLRNLISHGELENSMKVVDDIKLGELYKSMQNAFCRIEKDLLSLKVI